MKRRRTPSEKKELAYEKDHILRVEYHNTFRRSWPRKKARVNRKDRRKTHQYLERLLPNDAEQARLEATATPYILDDAQKWPGSVISLREHLAEKRRRIAQFTGHNYFRKAYAKEAHYEAFYRFIQQLLKDTSEYAYSVSRVLDELLTPAEELDQPRYSMQHQLRRKWLLQFFHDAPELYPAVQQWIAQCKERHGTDESS
jgi:hypothetical protein